MVIRSSFNTSLLCALWRLLTPRYAQYRWGVSSSSGLNLLLSKASCLTPYVALSQPLIDTSSPLPTSPIFRFPGVVPDSGSESPSRYSETSHWTVLLPSAETPIPLLSLCVRPSLLPSIISSNQDKSPLLPSR